MKLSQLRRLLPPGQLPGDPAAAEPLLVHQSAPWTPRESPAQQHGSGGGKNKSQSSEKRARADEGVAIVYLLKDNGRIHEETMIIIISKINFIQGLIKRSSFEDIDCNHD